jgi:hypothetical protein
LKYALLFAALWSIGTDGAAEREFIATHEVIVGPNEIHQGVRFPAGTRLDVMTNGVITYVFLGDDFTLGGHRFKKGTQLTISDAGMPTAAWTAAGQTFGDIVIEHPQTEVRFDDKARLESIHVNEPQRVRGIQFQQWIEFHPNGRLAHGLLAGDQTVAGLHLRDGTEIKWFPNGQIAEAVLNAPSTTDGLTLAAADPKAILPVPTTFWPNGRLKQGVLERGTQLQGYSAGSGPVEFFESGKLKAVTLGRACTIALHPYKDQAPSTINAEAGDSISLDETGEVTGWTERYSK